MKKHLLALPIIFMLIMPQLWAYEELDPEIGVYFPQTTNCMTIYAVAGGTVSAASYSVWPSSISFTSVGGLYPGTTEYSLYSTDKDTIGELITYLNARPATTPGLGGGLVCTISQGCYDGNVASSMTACYNTSIFFSSSPAQATIDAVIGMTYTIPADTTGKSVFLINSLVKGTFSSGELLFNVYDGDSATDTQIRGETVTVSATDAYINIPEKKQMRGSPDTAMRIDLVGTTEVTGAYMNIIYERRVRR